jgi:hypothetical protein
MPDTKKTITINDGAEETEANETTRAVEVKVDTMLEVKHARDLKTADPAPVEAETLPPDPLDDDHTVAAVDAITRKDGDEALEAMDEASEAEKSDDKKTTILDKIKGWIAAWWHNKRARWATIGGLVFLLLLAAILPPSRAFALNVVGVRTSASVTVLDATTQLPLKNATVALGSATALSNARGQVTLNHVKLGSQQLIVSKVAFATTKKSVSTSFGSNKLAAVALKAVGTQYHFTVTDYVTGKPVPGAQAASGPATALADKQGAIILTAVDSSHDTLMVNITASGYRTATSTVQVGSTQVTHVDLVTNRQTVYISKQTGKYDVYKASVDGNDKHLLLAATGNETSTNILAPNPDGQVAALVNNRDTTRDSSGYLLQTLTLINVSTGAATVIDHSERIQIVDWQADRLVYVAIKAGASAANPSRYLLMSYDYKSNQRLQLDHANAFNDVVSADGAIYYATSNGYNGGVSQFMKINADGSGKQVLLVSEVWNVFRLNYTDFHLATGDAAYTYKIGDAKPVTTTTSYTGQSRLYIDSPDGKHSLWVDDRDGKGTLVAYDTTSHKETVLAQVAGLSYPVRWLGNDTVIYRLKTSKETADYVVGVNGGTPKKVTDVTDAAGVTLWYYY